MQHVIYGPNCIHKNSFPEVNLNNRHMDRTGFDKFTPVHKVKYIYTLWHMADMYERQ